MATSVPASTMPRWYVRDVRARSIGDDGRILTGTAAGLAGLLRVEPVVVRLVFLVLAVAAGWGVVFYVAAWVWLTAGRDEPAPAVAAPDGSTPRRDAGVALVGFGVLLQLRVAGLGVVDELVWPVALVALAVGLVWRRVGAAELEALLSEGDRSPARVANRASWPRLVLGGVLVAIGAGALVGSDASFATATRTVVGLSIVLSGAAVVAGPNLRVLASALTDERARRIRADERGQISRHLHDSVLQTLALIQKRADDPSEVAALARQQERELRRWLFGGEPGTDTSLRSLVEQAAAEVEDLHRVSIDCVVVGDGGVDDADRDLVAACREALVNAAKFAAPARISLYAELGDSGAEVFVRDRGPGFDPEAVAPDRRGIADSIIGRMARIGGTAEVSSSAGDGTQVHLVLGEER